MSDEENEEGSDWPVLATTDFNDDGFVFYVHQHPRRGVDQTDTGAGENVDIADNG